MARAWRRRTGDTVTRETTEKPKEGEQKNQGATSTAIAPGGGSPRRVGVSYVAAVTHGTANGEPRSLMETALQGGGSIHTPASVETGEGSSDDGGGWDVVRRKRKRRRSLYTGTKPAMGREGRAWTRRPPPTRRTSRGIVEVCGKCYQPGHWARECKNREVCRRCGGEGHRERDCRRRPTARVKDAGHPTPPPRKATALDKVVEKAKETHWRWPPGREELCEDNKGKARLCTGSGSQQLTEDKAAHGGEQAEDGKERG